MARKAIFNFAAPVVWREPRSHADDCYFCLTNIHGFNASFFFLKKKKKKKKKIKYPNLPSAMRPVHHSDDLPVPKLQANKDLLSSSDENFPSGEDSVKSISFEDNVSVYSGTSDNEPLWIKP